MPDNYNDNRHWRTDNSVRSEHISQGSSERYDSEYSSSSGSSEVEFNSGSYAFTSENSSKTPKKSHVIFKSIVAVAAVVVVGACGIQVYKFLRDTRDELIGISNDNPRMAPVNETDDKAPDADKEPLPSLIELASRSDAMPIPDIVDSIMPSVVGVASTFEFESPQTFSIWGWNTQPQTQKLRETGTGIIISDDGYIVTNAHVVYDEDYNAGEATEVSVLFSDETEHEASIVAFDPETDIAVLKVNEKGLKPAVLGDSDELRVGELVIAVGNPLGFDLFGTVTSGIVSALDRKIDINEKKMNLIQTDAAINSGNSGGPLLNSCGQVIGINSAKISSNYSSSAASIEGLCFAIPIKEAKSIIDDLINYKYVTGRPQLGIISTIDITEAQSRYWNTPVGIFVMSLQEDGAAERAGIMVGDIIIDIEGEAVSTSQELNEIKNKYKAGDTVTLTVSRNGKDIKIKVTLQEQKNIHSKRSTTADDTFERT